MYEDFDSHMSVQFLEQLAKDAKELASLIDPEKNLEDWIDFKIGRARQDIADIRSYIEYQSKQQPLAERLASKGYLKASEIIKNRNP